MEQKSAIRSPSIAFLWPAIAAESMSEIASVMAKQFADLAIGIEPDQKRAEPAWATENKVALELASVTLRDFSIAPEGIPTLVCAPFAIHGASVADFAPGHSLVAALRATGSKRIFVSDWRSASASMRLLSIDNYLADLNILVDELGGIANLVGLCQGGWMALIFAARFPAKVRKLVLAGAPIDNAAGASVVSLLAQRTPMSVFRKLIELGNGRVLGRHALRFWGLQPWGPAAIHKTLQPQLDIRSMAFRRLVARFRDWYDWTVDLPGPYYLEVVEQLFKENRLARGRFVALGHPVDVSEVRCPIFLLAGRDDELVASEQMFAVELLIDREKSSVRKALAPCGHLDLFMGNKVLREYWGRIGRWLAAA
jgi:poly(3-hydroxybutyrate) depolymerase